MKSGTILRKIFDQIDAHSDALKQLLLELEEAHEKENIKSKEEIAKKISGTFNLELEQVLKKIIKKNKNKNSVENDINEILTSELIQNLEEDNIIPIYKKIIYEDKEYYYDDKPNGYVLEKNGDNTKIVGYIETQHLINPTIKFI